MCESARTHRPSKTKSASFGKSLGAADGMWSRSIAMRASQAPRDETDGLASIPCSRTPADGNSISSWRGRLTAWAALGEHTKTVHFGADLRSHFLRDGKCSPYDRRIWRCTEKSKKAPGVPGLQVVSKEKRPEGMSLWTPRYYPKAQISQGADRASAPTRRVCSTGRGFRSRRACHLLFARIVSRVDVIDRPRPNAMDLKDGLFLGPGEVVHLRLHNRHAAGRYSLGLGEIKLVSHADVKGAGDHSYVLDCGVRVRRNFEVRRKLNAEGERHCLIQRSLNDGNLRARWQRRHVSPFKIRGRNKRVSPQPHMLEGTGR